MDVNFIQNFNIWGIYTYGIDLYSKNTSEGRNFARIASEEVQFSYSFSCHDCVIPHIALDFLYLL